MTKRKIIFLTVFIFCAIAIFFIYRNFAIREITYETIAVERGDLFKTITDEGVFEPLTTIKVGSKIPGQITEILADFNTPVKVGDVLAKVESELSREKLEKAMVGIEVLNSEIKEADLGIEGAEITLGTAERNFEQNEILFRGQIISKEDFCASRDQLKKAINDLEAKKAKKDSLMKKMKEAQSDLRIAELEFDNSFVKSPIDGIVLEKFAEIGQTVSGASFQVYPLFEICSPLTNLKFVASVNEVNIGSINIGQEMKIKISTTIGTDEITASVQEIHNRPSDLLSRKVDYDVMAYIDNDDLKLKPAMKATYFIDFFVRRDVLKISKQKLEKAIGYAYSKGFLGKILISNDGGEIYARSIKEGVYIDGNIEISGEISEGELVVIGESNNAKSGLKTSPWQWKR